VSEFQLVHDLLGLELCKQQLSSNQRQIVKTLFVVRLAWLPGEKDEVIVSPMA
jgi:hypothetical protein